MAKRPAPPATPLPPDVLASDTHYPSYDENAKPWRVGEDADLPLSLTFYFIPEGRKAPAWVLCTLHISNPGRRSSSTTARTYGIGVDDSKVYTVGRGPHVKAEVTVYLSGKNIDRLRKYAELWKKGMADAGAIRDRISTRRAQGQLYRSQGRSSWMW